MASNGKLRCDRAIAPMSAQAVRSPADNQSLPNQGGGSLLASADGSFLESAEAQESKGAKYKGASADVADKIVKQLQRDIEKLERPPTVAPAK